MTLKEGTKALRSTLLEALAQFGFDEQKELIFIRPTSNGPIWKLAFPCRLDQANALRINCHVGVSYREVESVLRPGSIEDGDIYPTIMKPIHSLRDDGRFMEWVFTSVSGREEIKNAIIADINTIALPFLEKYSDINEVELELQNDDPKRWFVLNAEHRIATLAAIAYNKGDVVLAQCMVRSALEERANALPKKRRLLEDVAMRLNA